MNAQEEVSRRTIAFFDFDGTLVKGDSLWPFLFRAVGFWKASYAIFRAILRQFKCPLGKDKRTYFKENLLFYVLRGADLDEMAQVAARMKSWPVWIEGTVQALNDHHEKGHHIVIASGSLDLYLAALLEDLPCDDIICTRMECEEDTLTGFIASGNCVRQRKAQKVAEYLATHGPFEEVWAYGNAPHDLPMMEYAKTKVII